jgi:hypothetical protein
MSDVAAAPQASMPSDVYGIFAGVIDQPAVQRLSNALSIAVNGRRQPSPSDVSDDWR